MCEKLRELTATDSLKRPEENYKFIFKRCLKHMKDDFKKHAGEKLKKKDLDRAFYEHYFQDIVKKEKVSLESFFHPKNSKNKTADVPKTINNHYIENISKSPEFVKHFQKYLNEILEQEYRGIIDSKIQTMVHKWELDYQHAPPKEREKIIEATCAYIERNKKCKLPWTMNEVREAIIGVRKIFEHHAKNK